MRFTMSWSAGTADHSPEQREDSDIDILVDVEPSIGLRFVTLANELEELLGQRIGLVTSRAISPNLKPYVESESIEVA